MSAPQAGAPTPGERDAIEMLAREASIVALGAEPGEYDKWPHGDAADVPWSTQEDARAIARWVLGREAAARAEGHAAGRLAGLAEAAGAARRAIEEQVIPPGFVLHPVEGPRSFARVAEGAIRALAAQPAVVSGDEVQDRKGDGCELYGEPVSEANAEEHRRTRKPADPQTLEGVPERSPDNRHATADPAPSSLPATGADPESDRLDLLMDCWQQFAYPAEKHGSYARTDGGLSTLEELAYTLLEAGLIRRVRPNKDIFVPVERAAAPPQGDR